MMLSNKGHIFIVKQLEASAWHKKRGVVTACDKSLLSQNYIDIHASSKLTSKEPTARSPLKHEKEVL